MFTGIVEECGEVIAFEERVEAWRLNLRAPLVCEDIAVGDSVAVNGCCLTVVSREDAVLAFDLLEETIRRTSFRLLKPGLHVNLERAMPANGRFGGHFVSGHVDGTGSVSVLEPRGKNVYLKVSHPPQNDRYLIEKGSITIDGISLTVAELEPTAFAVWLIPHTLEVTQLSERQVGDPLNLEYDMLAKYAEKMLLPEGKASR